jgi:predicted metal-binding membrane protein
MVADMTHTSRAGFCGVAALLFAMSAAVTVAWCASMSTMGEMSMPGGWAMSMTWMRMPGQTWLGAAASFLGMWVVMMLAMMLPSLLPKLWRYPAPQAALIGVGYFLVWTVCGIAAYSLGVMLAVIEMQQPAIARAVPITVGVIVLLAGALQFTAWKAHHLACCRESPECCPTRSPLRYGLQLGLHCAYCCASLTAILLVIGVMDLWAMAVVTVAITAERLAKNPRRVARVIGVLVIGAGLFLIARAALA